MAVIEGSLSNLRKRLKDLELAKKAGYNIPDLLIDTVKGEIRKKEGIAEVWECNQCDQYLELGVHPKSVGCRCGKIRRTWTAKESA